jgi:hypothetical protein
MNPVKITVEDQDQWQCLQDDWSVAYDFDRSDADADERPFKSGPRADRSVPLEAASPRSLRAMVLKDHASRTAATSPERAAG